MPELTRTSTVCYGICAGDSDNLEEISLPAIQRTDPNSVVLVRRGAKSIFVAYNELIEEARALDCRDGLILLHDDVELLDCAPKHLLPLLRRPDVGVVGAIGARGHQGISWWHGGRPAGRAADTMAARDYGLIGSEVDTVDGLLMALSAWALLNLRFDDERYRGFHGYDADICAQARAAERKVVVADVPLFHHNQDYRYGDRSSYNDALYTWMMKWRNESWKTHAAWRIRRDIHRHSPRLARCLRKLRTKLSRRATGSE